MGFGRSSQAAAPRIRTHVERELTRRLADRESEQVQPRLIVIVASRWAGLKAVHVSLRVQLTIGQCISPVMGPDVHDYLYPLMQPRFIFHTCPISSRAACCTILCASSL